MPAIVSIARRNTNRGGAVTCTQETQIGYLNDALAQVFRKLAPVKTWAAVASVLGLTERVAKHRLSGTRDFTADELAALLRSEDGLSFLSAVMADSQPRWWLIFKNKMRAADIKRQQASMRRELEEAVNEASALETALMVSDSDFHSPTVDALRSMAHRVAPWAAPKRGR